MTAPPYQLKLERQLRDTLMADRHVKFALERLEKETTGYGYVARRRLLAHGLRLTRSMAPGVADAVAACKATLGVTQPVEVFVRPEPVINAALVRNPGGPPAIILSSRLIEVFSEAELRFVIGHELGHLAFDHVALPMPATAMVEDMAGVIVPRSTALQLYYWCRLAEVSADRAGLVCGQDPEAAASGFFKLASGLSSAYVKADLEAYAKQVTSLAAAPAARQKPDEYDDSLDCFSTHPYSPLRVRAVVAFSKSQAFAKLSGKGDGVLTDAEVDTIIERDFREMEPSYLEEKSEHAEVMRQALGLGAVLVANAHGGVSAMEKKAMMALLGAESLNSLLAEKDPKKAFDTLVPKLKDVPLFSRARLVQHLTVVAHADGNVADEEYGALGHVATALAVPMTVVDETIHGAVAPMD
jgi:tellurite resistance protein